MVLPDCLNKTKTQVHKTNSENNNSLCNKTFKFRYNSERTFIFLHNYINNSLIKIIRDYNFNFINSKLKFFFKN